MDAALAVGHHVEQLALEEIVVICVQIQTENTALQGQLINVVLALAWEFVLVLAPVAAKVVLDAEIHVVVHVDRVAQMVVMMDANEVANHAEVLAVQIVHKLVMQNVQLLVEENVQQIVKKVVETGVVLIAH